MLVANGGYLPWLWLLLNIQRVFIEVVEVVTISTFFYVFKASSMEQDTKRIMRKSRCTWTERVPMLRPQRLTLTRLVLPWPAGWNLERLSMIRHLFTATGKVTRASFSSHPKGTLKTYALEVIIKGPDGNHGLQRGEERKGVIKS